MDSLQNRNSQDPAVGKAGYSAHKKDTSPIDPKKQENEVEEPVEDLDDSGLLVEK